MTTRARAGIRADPHRRDRRSRDGRGSRNSRAGRRSGRSYVGQRRRRRTRRGRGVFIARADRGIGSPPRDRPHRDRQCVRSPGVDRDRARDRDRAAHDPLRRRGVHRSRRAHRPPSSGRSAANTPHAARDGGTGARRSSRPAYRRAAADGATGVVVVSLSGALSATMQSAELAARSVADEIAGPRRRQPQRDPRARHDRRRLRPPCRRRRRRSTRSPRSPRDLGVADAGCSARSTRSRT